MSDKDKSEYLCLNCGLNETCYEYCDDCLETTKGDWAILSALEFGQEPDWVVHVTEEQEQYGYVADAIETMLNAGRAEVIVLSGARAQAAPARREPEHVPHTPFDGKLWLEGGGRRRELGAGVYIADLVEDLNALLERHEEVRFLTASVLAAASERDAALFATAPRGPLSRPSALAR